MRNYLRYLIRLLLLCLFSCISLVVSAQHANEQSSSESLAATLAMIKQRKGTEEIWAKIAEVYATRSEEELKTFTTNLLGGLDFTTVAEASEAHRFQQAYSQAEQKEVNICAYVKDSSDPTLTYIIKKWAQLGYTDAAGMLRSIAGSNQDAVLYIELNKLPTGEYTIRTNFGSVTDDITGPDLTASTSSNTGSITTVQQKIKSSLTSYFDGKTYANYEDAKEAVKRGLGVNIGFEICFWFKSTLNSWWPSTMDDKINNRFNLFTHISSRFDNYLEASKVENVLVANDQSWSIRNSSYNVKSNTTIVQRIIKRILEEESPTLTLHQKGIYLGSYKLEGKEFKLAIYAEAETFKVSKVRVNALCDLVDNSSVKVLIKDDHTLISFFNGDQLTMTMQISGGDEGTAKLWLKYLGILIEQPSYLQVVKKYWNRFISLDKDENLNDKNVYNEGKDFVIKLFEGEVERSNGDITLISSEPAMPDLKVKVISKIKGEYQIKLVIEYLRQCTGRGANRTPNQSESFPANGWKKIQANDEWDIDLGTDQQTNRPKIRGGIAYLIVKSLNNVEDTLKFYIKGQNPTVSQVNEFVNQAPYNQLWFFKKIVFHESGTPNNLETEARQFNRFNQSRENLGESWDAISRMPNFGAPCGWGLMQLDNPAPSAQALWDWKANILVAYNLLVQTKKVSVNNHLRSCMNKINSWNAKFADDPVIGHANQADGSITYCHSSSNHFDNTNISNLNDHFTNILEGNNRSFIDACWIKTYNGLGAESLHYYYVTNGKDEKPEWRISNTATYGTSINYYIRSISNQSTPN